MIAKYEIVFSHFAIKNAITFSLHDEAENEICEYCLHSIADDWELIDVDEAAGTVTGKIPAEKIRQMISNPLEGAKFEDLVRTFPLDEIKINQAQIKRISAADVRQEVCALFEAMYAIFNNREARLELVNAFTQAYAQNCFKRDERGFIDHNHLFYMERI